MREYCLLFWTALLHLGNGQVLDLGDVFSRGIRNINPLVPIQSGVKELSQGFKLPSLQDFGLLKDNFGIQKGPGCFPIFGEVVKLLWSDCQQKADSLTWVTWGQQIQNALQGGQIDLVHAGRETCKLQADRQNCENLAQRMQNCDIFGTIGVTVELQTAKQRCEQLTGFASFVNLQSLGLTQQQPQAATQLFGNIGNLIGGEVAGGFLRHFLG